MSFAGARSSLDGVLDDISRDSKARPGAVASPGGTIPMEERIARGYINADSAQPLPPDADALFGATKAYINYKKEQPSHRLMLWYKLQGYSNKEVSALVGYSYHTVCQVVKQLWFQEAFCRLAEEMGKDAINTFLEGEVMPALMRTVDLAKNSESEAIRTANNREILDRFLGKSTVKVESKSAVDINHTVVDAAALLAEQRRLDESLKANGLVSHGRS